MKPDEYRTLIKAFLDGMLTADEFAASYDRVFSKDPGPMDRPLFDILENLFEDVDAYSPLWTPEEIGPTAITEETLRQEAAQALMELEEYLKADASAG